MLKVYLKQVESQNPDLVNSSAWINLKNYVANEFPDLVQIGVGLKYTMQTKKGTVNMQVTKENQKTWVMYELENSARPSCRWMISKSWCTEDHIQPISTDAMIPFGTKVK